MFKTSSGEELTVGALRAKAEQGVDVTPKSSRRARHP